MEIHWRHLTNTQVQTRIVTSYCTSMSNWVDSTRLVRKDDLMNKCSNLLQAADAALILFRSIDTNNVELEETEDDT